MSSEERDSAAVVWLSSRMRRFLAPVRSPEACLIGISCVVTILLGRTIGHDRIEVWDEGFHAVVAAHLARHPLVPTLYDREWLHAPHDWYTSHIWLHKPPLGMWQIAASYRLFGVNSFALRLPSVLCLWGAIIATYALGRRLYHDRWVGAIAAGLLALNPFVLGLVEGEYASDHVDVALLFYVLVGLAILLRAMHRDTWGHYVLAGVAAGLAMLTKGPPGLLLPGIALTLYLAHRHDWSIARELHLTARRVVLLSAVAVTVVLPWYVYAGVRWPGEFQRESGGWLHHMTVNVEGWEAPWDRHIFDYMVQHAPWLYPLLVIAFGAAAFRAVRGSFADGFIALWASFVVLPFSIATSKVPALTVIALPALLLAFARLLVGAIHSRSVVDASALASGTIALLLVRKGKSALPWRPLPPSESSWSIAPTLSQNSWLAGELTIALGVLMVAYLGWRFRRQLVGRLGRASLALALPVTVAAGFLYCREAVHVARRRSELPCWHELGDTLRRMEASVVVLYADKQPSDRRYMSVMFWSGRPVYSTTLHLGSMSIDSAATLIRGQGGTPVLVAPQGPPQNQLATCSTGQRAIYRLPSP